MKTLWEYDDIIVPKLVYNDVYSLVLLAWNVEYDKYLLIDIVTGFVITENLDKHQMADKLTEYNYKISPLAISNDLP